MSLRTGRAVLVVLFMGVFAQITTGMPGVLLFSFVSNIDSETYGTIQKVETNRVGRNHNLKFNVIYSYEVNGRQYIGKRLNLGLATDDIYEKQDLYQEGSVHIVYFDSSSPEYALLDNSPLDFIVWFHVLAILGLGLITYAFWT